MSIPVPSLQRIWSRTNLAVYFINGLGALLTFLYFSLIDPLPLGTESLQRVGLSDVIPVLLAILVTFTAGSLRRRNYHRRVNDWFQALMSGTSAADVPESIRRDVLNAAINTAFSTVVMWLLVSLFFAWYAGSYRQFAGLAITGVFATSLLYLVVDLLWRPLVPFFFPKDEVSDTRAFRLPVLGRLLLVLLLVGLLPPILLMNLSWERARALLSAPNPQAVLDNLFYLQLFILAVSVVASVGLAILVTRSITTPLKRLQEAMGRVQQNDMNVAVPVTTNDELGYLAERFNQMVEGLRQGERLRRLFDLYVSPEVAQAAVERGAGLGGELVTCTIVFCDLRGFTRLSEGMPPGQLVELINRYMTRMVGIIARHEGIVTRFGGDSILAVFGSPLNPLPNHAAQAVRSALAMASGIEGFNQEQAATGEPTLEMGIGVATGQVVAGNVGGKERIEYTVMGDAVNLAARLQDKTKEVDGEILLSEETHRQASQELTLQARQLGAVPIKGKREPQTLYVLAAE